MCGIFGLWNLDGHDIDRGSLRAGTEALHHRGPDDSGFLLVNSRSGDVVSCGGPDSAPDLHLPDLNQLSGVNFDLGFGFRRLSILDRSPSGHQPMQSSDGDLWIVFNGAVYNYLELRTELKSKGHRFSTGTDTEVILASYKEWGSDCLQRFNGMWAFAIWDSAALSLFLARDRFGVKPLYRGGTPETFAFASEIKALLASGVCSFDPDPFAISRYIAHGGMPSHRAGETFIDGIQEIPASHHLIVTREREKQTLYWQIEADSGSVDPEPAILVQRDLFEDAVRLRLRADVSVGSCLSGGLDSSSIVATIARLMLSERDVLQDRLGEHQRTFSAVYETPGRWDESIHIDRVVTATGASGNKVVPTAEGLWAEIESIVWHQDEPFQSTSIYAQWCVMQRAKQTGVTVVLDGQGADEVLGGYAPQASQLSELIRRGRLSKALVDARHMTLQMDGVDPMILPKAFWKLLPPGLDAWRLERKHRRNLGATPLRDALMPHSAPAFLEATSIADRRLSSHLEFQLTESTLPNLLRYEDRNSMAFSLEARVPFLDYRLVNHAFGSAAPYRLHEGWTKWVQRKAIEPILPPQIVWRRDKVGFGTPENDWLRTGKHQLLERVRSSPRARDYLDPKKAEAIFDRALTHSDPYGPWRWMNLAVWLDVMDSRGRARS